METLMQKKTTETHNRIQQKILKLTQQPQVLHQLNLKQELETDFSNERNSALITDYEKKNLEVFENSKNKKRR